MKFLSAIIPALVLMPAISSASQSVEIAPFTDQRYGGSFADINTSTEFEVADANAYGLVLDFDTKPGKQIEIYLSRQNTHLPTNGICTGSPLFDLSIDYCLIGGCTCCRKENGCALSCQVLSVMRAKFPKFFNSCNNCEYK